MSSPNMFEDTSISYQMIDNVCYINGEELVSHLKLAVSRGVDEVINMVSLGGMNATDYAIASAAITGMAGVGM